MKTAQEGLSELRVEVEEMKIALEIMAASNKACDDKYNHELNKHQARLNRHGEQIRGLDENTTKLDILEDKHYQLAEEVALMEDQLCHCCRSVSRLIVMVFDR